MDIIPQYHDYIRDVLADTTTHRFIYRSHLANELFYFHDFPTRRLSIMKQQNIRTALEDDRTTVSSICAVVSAFCGFCFKHHDVSGCFDCPLRSNDTDCHELPEFQALYDPQLDKHEFAGFHKKWLIKLGLWNDVKKPLEVIDPDLETRQNEND